jgi:arylformamidase
MGLRIVDLSHVLRPGEEQYTLIIEQRGERRGREGDVMSEVRFLSHVGTHAEAPLHFLANGPDIASIPLDAFIGPAVVLDLRHKGTNEPIDVQDLQQAGHVAIGDRVLIWTGRDVLYRTASSHDRPFLTEDAARWLVSGRRIKLLGTDSSGYEVRGVVNYPNHRIFSEAGVPVIECLANLNQLTQKRVFFIGLPWAIQGLDASPIRAVALEGVSL